MVSNNGLSRAVRIGSRLPAIGVLTVLLCGGCADLPTRITLFTKPADHAAQENDIWEAVFRYRMELMGSRGPFFLSIDGNDPSDIFMARFAASGTRVKKYSESYFKKDPSPGWLRDRSTDEKAIVLSVRPVTWISDDHAELRGDMYCGGLCADAGIYRLAKKNGRWAVEQYEAHMHA